MSGVTFVFCMVISTSPAGRVTELIMLFEATWADGVAVALGEAIPEVTMVNCLVVRAEMVAV